MTGPDFRVTLLGTGVPIPSPHRLRPRGPSGSDESDPNALVGRATE